jgi:hypothetical protein
MPYVSRYENAEFDCARRDFDDELPELDPALCKVLLTFKRGPLGMRSNRPRRVEAIFQ